MGKNILIIILIIICVALLVTMHLVLSFTRKTLDANKRLMEEARVKGEEAIKSARAKTEFVANMSHEIRVPMNAISFATDLLNREELNSSAKSYLNVLKNSSDSLLDMVNGILDFSKMDAGCLSLVENEYDLQDVFMDVKSIVSSKSNSFDVPFIIKISPDTPKYLVGDDVRIKQILVNLLSNSIKYTTKGNISLEVYTQPIDSDFVNMFISVKDTGCGIPPTAKELLLKSFDDEEEGVNSFLEGTGLGLRMCNSLAKIMGGSVTVESELGKGTSFLVKIKQGIGDRREPVASVDVCRTLATDVLLWVENEHLRNNLFDIFSSLSIPVRVVETSEEFEEVAIVSKPDCAVISGVYMDSAEGFLSRMAEVPYIISLMDTGASGDRIVGSEFASLKFPYDIFDVLEILKNRVYDENVTDGKQGAMKAPDAHVLVVDDNRVNLKVAKALIETFDIQADTADSGMEAIEKIENGEKYDLIFMDHMMPGLDGIETANRIWELEDKNNRTNIIALAANEGRVAERIFIDAGMCDFITKPLVMNQLNYALRKWLPKKLQIQDDIAHLQMERQMKKHADSFEADWGLTRVWNDEKIYFEVLHIFVDKSEELAKKIEDCNDMNAAIEAAKEFVTISISVGATRMPALLTEMVSVAEHGETDIYVSRLEHFREEYGILCEAVNKYLEKEELADILTMY